MKLVHGVNKFAFVTHEAQNRRK